MKIELELTAGRRFVAEMKAQDRIKRRVAEAAQRNKPDDCPCPLCVARRSGGGIEGLLGTLFGLPREPAPSGSDTTKH